MLSVDAVSILSTGIAVTGSQHVNNNKANLLYTTFTLDGYYSLVPFIERFNAMLQVTGSKYQLQCDWLDFKQPSDRNGGWTECCVYFEKD